jgi:Leucine-rich repeat (LRR) protein
VVRQSKLTHIFKEDLANMPHLKTLDLSENEIRILGSNLLEDSPKIEVIKMSKNLIAKISQTHFLFFKRSAFKTFMLERPRSYYQNFQSWQVY